MILGAIRFLSRRFSRARSATRTFVTDGVDTLNRVERLSFADMDLDL